MRRTLGARLASIVLVGALVGIGSAQEDRELVDLVRAVDGHPGLRAAAASTEAARLRAAAVRSPVTLSVAYEHRRLVVESATDPLPPPFDELFAVEETSDTLTLSATFRPFLVGDLADLYDTRLADLERSELSLREARAGLEAQSVTTAVAVVLGHRGLALAEHGAAIARRAADATALRLDGGAATELDARRAALQLEDAERGVATALRQVRQAEEALGRLVGPARLGAVPRIAPILGVTPDLVRASLDVAMADLGLRAQGRGLLPTVQAGYTWLFDDDGGSLTLGIESRTLQPSLSYSTAGGGGGGIGDAVGGLAPGGATPTVRGSLSVGVTWTISPQLILERDAAAATFEAAAAALAGAHDRAVAERQALEANLAGADASLALARLELDLVRDEARAAQARFEAGLIGPLELDRARFAVDGAELDLERALADRLSAVLDFYVSYAIPLSEVLP